MEFFTSNFPIFFLCLTFLLGTIIYIGQVPIWKKNPIEDMKKYLSENSNDSLDDTKRKYYRVQYTDGTGVGNYGGWNISRHSAVFHAEENGVTEANIHEYNLTEKEAFKLGVPPQLIEYDLSGPRIRNLSNIHIGPRGGRYRYNSKGHKSYDV